MNEWPNGTMGFMLGHWSKGTKPVSTRINANTLEYNGRRRKEGRKEGRKEEYEHWCSS
jgi:hypothetical protein